MQYTKFLLIILLCCLCAGGILLLVRLRVTRSTPALPGMVIVLNGPSAVGKSSIIKAFQAKQNVPWLSIGIDNFFVGVLPQKFYLENHPEVMHLTTTEDTKGKIATLSVGPEGQRVIKGMHRAIAAYAHAGNNVIVDYIKYYPEWIGDLQEVLQGVKVVWVGVTASLEVIQQREKQRGTSPEGHGRSLYNTVHQDMHYDLMLNTDLLTPEQAADQIIASGKI